MATLIRYSKTFDTSRSSGIPGIVLSASVESAMILYKQGGIPPWLRNPRGSYEILDNNAEIAKNPEAQNSVNQMRSRAKNITPQPHRVWDPENTKGTAREIEYNSPNYIKIIDYDFYETLPSFGSFQAKEYKGGWVSEEEAKTYQSGGPAGLELGGWVRLDCIPQQLQVESRSNFVALASMGRNNPHYHFTGAEDSLEFTIDWFSDEPTHSMVIKKCRWLESLSKADGYDSPPHRVMVVWGAQGQLFEKDLWIVAEAPYTISNFDGYMNGLPKQAYQKVVLKRVIPYNRSYKDMR